MIRTSQPREHDIFGGVCVCVSTEGISIIVLSCWSATPQTRLSRFHTAWMTVKSSQGIYFFRWATSAFVAFGWPFCSSAFGSNQLPADFRQPPSHRRGAASWTARWGSIQRSWPLQEEPWVFCTSWQSSPWTPRPNDRRATIQNLGSGKGLWVTSWLVGWGVLDFRYRGWFWDACRMFWRKSARLWVLGLFWMILSLVFSLFFIYLDLNYGPVHSFWPFLTSQKVTSGAWGTLCIPMEGPIWRVDGLETANPPVDPGDPSASKAKSASQNKRPRRADRTEEKARLERRFWGEHVRIYEALFHIYIYICVCIYIHMCIHKYIYIIYTIFPLKHEKKKKKPFDFASLGLSSHFKR